MRRLQIVAALGRPVPLGMQSARESSCINCPRSAAVNPTGRKLAAPIHVSTPQLFGTSRVVARTASDDPRSESCNIVAVVESRGHPRGPSHMRSDGHTLLVRGF